MTRIITLSAVVAAAIATGILAARTHYNGHGPTAEGLIVAAE